MQAKLIEFPVSEAGMKLRNEDQEWLRSEISKAIQVSIDSFTPKGWKRVTNWLREWGITTIAVTVPITLLGIALAAVYVAVGEVKQNAEFRGRTDQRLRDIESFIALLQAPQNPKTVLGKIGSLDQKVFPQFLPALRKVTEQPINAVQPNPETLQAILVKLRHTDETSPDYWPAVLQFLSFVSATLAPAGVPPSGQPPIVLHNSSAGRIVEEAQTIRLDGGSIENGEFTKCRIIFTQNPVRMKNVLFTNCVFEIPSTEPNLYLKKAGQLLLASNLNADSGARWARFRDPSGQHSEMNPVTIPG